MIWYICCELGAGALRFGPGAGGYDQYDQKYDHIDHIDHMRFEVSKFQKAIKSLGPKSKIWSTELS